MEYEEIEADRHRAVNARAIARSAERAGQRQNKTENYAQLVTIQHC